jgi:protein tyrosine/serine phosphatase
MKRLSCTPSFAVVALVLALPAAAQTGHPLSTHVRIDNFGQVNATYYRGSQPNDRDYTDLAALGIKTIIDLQEDGDSAEPGHVQRAGMKYYRIPMSTHVSPTDAQITKFLRIVTDPVQQPVYVHCAGGRHRTGVMTAVYRMSQDRWTPDQAFNEMKRYRFGADFLHSEFKRFVFAYHPAPVAPPVETVADSLPTAQ